MNEFQLPNKPHFFQPLLPDFLTNFSIPKSFLTQYLPVKGRGSEVKSKEFVVLRNRKSEQTWYVKVDLPNYTFKKGWRKFCADHNLQIGDFLVFKHQRDMVFEVYVFDPSACEREFPGFEDDSIAIQATPLASRPPINYHDGLEKKGDEEDPKEISTFKPSGRPYFRTQVKKAALAIGSIWVPKSFVLQAGLEKKTSPMVLLDEEGHSWSISLKYNEGQDGHYMYKCPSIYKLMGLDIGQPIVFELINSSGYLLMKLYKE
ncbi:B3 domain-containing protein REM9 [Spinacia oleracea]|uniref:B3 domain-containing protein REM9 n=1 Tax=Spinacia oleracea TaxID=3562 RepID=A0ABM3R7K3_SPIOL|nr:B3 domain-containing protein REM9-like [Spinacia oleracea]XP_056691598.1 B3 domain-containing protein REM9-like [Spinacia oleracea]